VSVAASEAYAAEFGILAKVASKKQPANRLNCKIYQILPGTLLKFKATTAKSLRTISVDSLIRQFEISAAIRPVGSPSCAASLPTGETSA